MSLERSPEIPCVGAVVFDDAGRLLLIRRGNPPAQGKWSLPGGRVESGEDLHDAVLRELQEETGLVGVVDRHVGAIRRDAPGGGVYVIDDFLLRVDDPAPLRAGDDASDAAWYSMDQLAGLDTSTGLVEILQGWGLVPKPLVSGSAPPTP